MVGAAHDREIIDEIIYLASLVSERRAIDPLLDKVRAVTARLQVGGALGPKDQSNLQQVEKELFSYLTKRDPLRTFTVETLQERVDEQMGRRPRGMGAAKLLLVILGASGAGLLALFALMPGGVRGIDRVMLALPGFIVPLHAGIIWLFWSALRDFRPGLRRAYGLICLGIVMTLIGAVQFPFLFAFPQLLDWPVFRYGGFLPFFAVMCGLFYFGLRMFAQMLGMTTRWASLRIVLPLAVIVTAVTVWLPHAAVVRDEAFFDVSVVSFVLCAVFSVPSAFLARMIARSVSGRYQRAMGWFSLTQVVIAVASLLYAGAVFVLGPTSGFEISVIASPFMVSELLLLVSGYIFKKDIGA